MNGRNYNDFKIPTVADGTARPEPVEGPFYIFTRGTIYTDFSAFARKATRKRIMKTLKMESFARILRHLYTDPIHIFTGAL